MSKWSLQLNAALGSLVVTFGLWLVWGEASVLALAGFALLLGVLLSWGSSSLAAVWAWSTALLGLESFALAVVTIIHGKLADREPTEEEMVSIFTAMLFGLFSSIFWLTFSYGIYKKFVRVTSEPAPPDKTMQRGRKSR
ncbi:hypothetical protein [Nitrospira sp. Nam74]